MQLPNISRREFLKRSVASGCAFAVGGLMPVWSNDSSGHAIAELSTLMRSPRLPVCRLRKPLLSCRTIPVQRRPDDLLRVEERSLYPALHRMEPNAALVWDGR